MSNREIELFVPGRLCIMGEHSDWAGKYRKDNNKLEKGYAIVTGIEEGIYAKCKLANNFIVRFIKDNNMYFECSMNLEKLIKVAENGDFFSYVAGVAYCIKKIYDVGGIEINITNETVPIKKGLASSAAICVLVTKAFNQLYNLNLSTLDEMNIAYQGEITTPSRCGRLDQACIFGKKPVLMVFDGENVSIEKIKVGNNLYFVFADLMSKKDTIKILESLNKSFPFAKNIQDNNIQKGLGKINKNNIKKSIEFIENGDAKGLGKMLTKAQADFDKYVAPSCLHELKSPLLHKTLNNEYIKKLSYGGKGVGSQGDGAIQFLAKNRKNQLEIKRYLQKELGMNAYTLIINKTND